MHFGRVAYTCAVLLSTVISFGASADEMNQYTLTQAGYSWDADMDAAVESEFGPDARVADWVDLETNFAGQIGLFCDTVGLLTFRSHAWVYRNGVAFYSSNRHYFVQRHNGSVPGGWAVHDHIDGHTLSLGSWWNSRKILVRLPDSVPTSITTWSRLRAIY